MSDNTIELQDFEKRNIAELKQTIIETIDLSSQLLALESGLSPLDQLQVLTDTVQDALAVGLKQHCLNWHAEYAESTILGHLHDHPEQKGTKKIGQAWGMACKQHVELAENLH